jgi:hypothetical protein
MLIGLRSAKKDVIQFGYDSITHCRRIKDILSRSSAKINELLEEDFHKNHLYIKSGLISEHGHQGQVLRLGSQEWEKGKIRIKFEIEFIPDTPKIQEPESCLDDIRREIQNM